MMTGNNLTRRELKIAERIRLRYAGSGMTDIVVYPGLDCIPIFGYAVSDNGRYSACAPVDDSLTSEQRAAVLKNLDAYRRRDCKFRTILAG